MEIIIGLLIIAIGAFCQSSCYVPINKIKDWSWESYWIVQGVFAWLVLPFLGAMLAVPSGHTFFELFGGHGFNVVFSNVWGIILKEWKGCSRKTIVTLVVGIVVLIVSCFLPVL